MKKKLLCLAVTLVMCIGFACVNIASAGDTNPYCGEGWLYHKDGVTGSNEYTIKDAENVNLTGSSFGVLGDMMLRRPVFDDNYTVSCGINGIENTDATYMTGIMFWFSDTMGQMEALLFPNNGNVGIRVFGILSGAYINGHGWAFIKDDALPGATLDDVEIMSVKKEGLQVSITVNDVTVDIDFSGIANASNMETAPTWVGVVNCGYTAEFTNFRQASSNGVTAESSVHQGSWESNPALPAGCNADDPCVIVFATISDRTDSNLAEYGVKIISDGGREYFFKADTESFACNEQGNYGIAVYGMPAGNYTAYGYVKLNTYTVFATVDSVILTSSAVEFTVA